MRMRTESKEKKKIGRRILAAVSLFLIALILMMLSRRTDFFADWYAANIFPAFSATIGRLLSPIPFSVAEWLLYAGILFLLFSLIRAVIGSVRNRRKKKENTAVSLSGVLPLARCFSGILLACSVLFLIYTSTCGILYARTGFAETEGFDVRESSLQELEETCLMLVEQINEEADSVVYSPEGSSVAPSSKALADQTRTAMEQLGEKYPELAGFYPNPKNVTFSALLSYQKLTGIYSPFTIEANINRQMPGYEMPATMCHELSHLKGFMREDEAGFIAYLACTGSDNAYLRYSGAMHAFSYCISAYRKEAGTEAYRELYAKLDERARTDRSLSSAFWAKYDGPVAETATSVNNVYLKSNLQTDGVKSYGRMVDLMIAWWRML